MRSQLASVRPRIVGFLAISLSVLAGSTPIRADCPFCTEGPAGGQGPNVRWSSGDSLTVCPAGDSVIVNDPLHLHPSRLRIAVEYFDNSCAPRVRVPPDSIWVTFAISSGNLVVNDQGAQTVADDSTNSCGFARVTIPSISGCGTLSVYLYVAGVSQGSRLITVRSTDTDADGRTTGFDTGAPCDLDYNGAIGTNDIQLINAHTDHWRRNALHGTLVRRTNYCETCPEETPGVKGGSEIFWSPSGRFISHTQFIQVGQNVACKVFVVPSDPKDGDGLTQFTFAPYDAHDYDPSWSPRNDFIAWDRNDRIVIRKRVPWSGDTSQFVVTTSHNSGCSVASGDDTPAISPNGEWVAFSRCNPDPPGGWSIWKVSINGGTAIQLTPTVANASFYPTWSPDGQTIYFQRQDAFTYGDSRWTLWKVPAAGGTAQEVLVPPGPPAPLTDAIQPAPSPDGKILLTGYGSRDILVRNVIARTLDLALSTPTAQKVIPNYPDTNFAEKGVFPELSPRLSPDGTRTALGSKQIWAARRNMNRPPAFVSVTSSGGVTRTVVDTAAVMSFTFSCQFHATNTVTVSASDPEGDALTYLADFLAPGFDWDPATRTLTYVTGQNCPGGTYYVLFRVTTASGGTDALIAAITFATAGSGGAVPSAARQDSQVLHDGRRALAAKAPGGEGGIARLLIFDLAGRRVAVVTGRPGERFLWDGREDSGSLAATGVYLYRVESGSQHHEGKFVVVR